MNSMKIAIAVTLLASSLSGLSQAAPQDIALNSCVNAFAATVQPGAAVKLSYAGSPSSSVIDFALREYSFVLEAKNAKTGIATAANCNASSDGKLVSLKPIKALEAKYLISNR